jgi:hypothetical protein
MLRWSAVLATTALAASSAAAQAVCSTDANFDFVTLDCLQCVVHPSGRDVYIEYGAEPVVRALSMRDVPLRVGDVVVSVEGALITTPAGSRRLAHPAADQATRFTVRRDGKEIELSVMPAGGCGGGRGADGGFGGGGGGGGRGGRAGRPIQFQFGTNIGSFDSTGRITVERFNREQNAAGRGFGSGVDTVYRMNAFIGDSALHQMRIRIDTLRGRMLMTMKDSGRMGSVFEMRGDGVDHERIDTIATHELQQMVERIRAATGRAGTSGGMSVFLRNDSSGLRRVDTLNNVIVQELARRMRDATGRGAIGGAMIGSSARGWIGFGVDCGGCTVTSGTNGAVWHFEGNPVIAGVDPDGPADIAGVLAGDILRSIDGMSISSNEGGRRFSSLQPGQKVRLTVDRRGHSLDLVITASKRPN